MAARLSVLLEFMLVERSEPDPNQPGIGGGAKRGKIIKKDGQKPQWVSQWIPWDAHTMDAAQFVRNLKRELATQRLATKGDVERDLTARILEAKQQQSAELAQHVVVALPSTTPAARASSTAATTSHRKKVKIDPASAAATPVRAVVAISAAKTGTATTTTRRRTCPNCHADTTLHACACCSPAPPAAASQAHIPLMLLPPTPPGGVLGKGKKICRGSDFRHCSGTAGVSEDGDDERIFLPLSGGSATHLCAVRTLPQSTASQTRAPTAPMIMLLCPAREAKVSRPFPASAAELSSSHHDTKEPDYAVVLHRALLAPDSRRQLIAAAKAAAAAAATDNNEEEKDAEEEGGAASDVLLFLAAILDWETITAAKDRKAKALKLVSLFVEAGGMYSNLPHAALSATVRGDLLARKRIGEPGFFSQAKQELTQLALSATYRGALVPLL